MGVIVETTHGRVEGVQSEGHQRFRGIPFAAPPLGERRFRAPHPPEPWSGVWDATGFRCSAPQPPSALPGMAVGEQGEDCLYLNVYTPAADDGRRPVLVWIHGGGFTTGSGSQDLYDGGRLARRGDVVVVTLNYRLGTLGYLHLASVVRDASGTASNLGQLDQIAALEWVRDNIAAFGGDATNVTIFGESAGGMAVATLLGMPSARGLFRRAIPQSGAAHQVHSEKSAARVAEVLLAELDLSPGDAEKLRAIPIERILKAQVQAVAKLQRENRRLSFAPMVDGTTLPEPPLEAVRKGEAPEVALLVGSNRDEAKLFHLGTPGAPDLDEAGLVKRVRAGLPRASADAAERIIEVYRKARQGRASTDPAELADAIESDRMFRIPAARLAEAQCPHQPATYVYLFTWESPARRGALGACHALELPFVFGTLDAPTMDRFAGSGPDAETLSARLMDAWIAFARHSDPNHAGLPHWRAYDAERRPTLILDREPELVNDPLAEERAIWDGIL